MSVLRTLPLRMVSAWLRGTRGGVARWRLVRYALRKAKQVGPDVGPVTVRTHFGFRMHLNPGDWVDQHIYATGNFEDSTAETIAALLSPGDCSLDVGANIGFFTLLMSQRVGPGGTVWAFEPSPQTRARLVRNLELNRAANVTLREEALSDADGASRFFTGREDHSGIASLRPLAAGGAIEVSTRRLSGLLPASLRPRLIKMDIEGAEFLALRGMADVLREHHPDLVIEMSDHFLGEMGSSSAEVYEFLRQLGYRMHHIDWDALVPYDALDPALPQQFNALFTTRTELPANLRIRQPARVAEAAARAGT